jgi:hypothetical protein
MRIGSVWEHDCAKLVLCLRGVRIPMLWMERSRLSHGE